MAKVQKEVDIERLIAQEASDFIKELEVSTVVVSDINHHLIAARIRIQVERVLKSFKLK